MARILLIEDDPLIRDSLAMALRRHGHEVRVAASGEEGLRLAADGVELVVLDVMLPGMDGFEVCRRLRARGDVAVIMLTAREDDIDVVGGLEAGADDYVVKPVLPRVLDARIKAVLRRGGRDVQSGTVRFGALEIDRDGLTVAKNGVAVALTPTELRLLLELSGAPGQVFSRQQLLERVWEHDYLGDSRLVDNGIQRLRAKIEDDPAAPLFVQTVRGFGYRFGPI
ncbi:putative two-component response regulator [Nocardia brasiliensis NBRC 14402]|uniref:response regulator transcription factor n=1 Tax=Nocardia brasiliensis TaxID=37326 RepID=UPI0003057974|nr:response regulator transcription factor [Nocardia brasiliensis]ASF09375.1 DNA-binding response regulator [Nocardia brasiliensis]GAJ86699.1 putative two-component response regulator [Nocardia brasiliensis NBRC 14402]SUB39930.1 Transcriptional regulatory protein AfsQ1 [Nocardia brasiliensis]